MSEKIYINAEYLPCEINNPQGPDEEEIDSTADRRVLRGGSIFSADGDCRAAKRFFEYPNNKSNFYGFRICLTKD